MYNKKINLNCKIKIVFVRIIYFSIYARKRATIFLAFCILANLSMISRRDK